MYKGSNLFISSPTLVILHFVGYGHPSGFEVVYHCGFDLYYLMLLFFLLLSI